MRAGRTCSRPSPPTPPSTTAVAGRWLWRWRGSATRRGADLLAALAADPTLDSTLRWAAAVALARLGDGRGADLLAALAADPTLSSSDRREAAVALDQLNYGDGCGADDCQGGEAIP